MVFFFPLLINTVCVSRAGDYLALTVFLQPVRKLMFFSHWQLLAHSKIGSCWNIFTYSRSPSKRSDCHSFRECQHGLPPIPCIIGIESDILNYDLNVQAMISCCKFHTAYSSFSSVHYLITGFKYIWLTIGNYMFVDLLEIAQSIQ